MRRGLKEKGFSLVEAMIVVAVVLAIVGLAIFQIAPSMKGAKSQAALETTLGVLRRYHEAAVDQRRIYQVVFTQPGTIQVNVETFDADGSVSWLPVETYQLPAETQFVCVSGIPTVAPPDGLGHGVNSIDFMVDNGGGYNTVVFQKDGRATDTLGRLNNGVLYIAQPGELNSSKAVTVLGATGRVKGWRLFQGPNGVSWGSL